MLIGLLLAASVLAAGTAQEKDAAAEYENVVHPGRDDGTRFWNEKATWFMYAPAFPFKSVPGAVRYRFTVTDTKGGRNVFTAEKPTAALSPVWSKVNVADVTVVCEGVDADGKAVGTAGERTFWKAAGFVPGKCPLPDRDLREAARRVYAYIFNKPATQYLLDTGKFDPKDPINSYAAKNGSALIRAMLTYAKLDPARRDRALLVAEKAADYLASISSPAGTPLEYLVPTYAGPGESETGLKNADRTMLSEPALIPPCFLDLFHATGKAKYRELAVRMGETLLRLQGDDGTWHLKVFLKDAQPCDPNRLLPIGMIDTLERLYAETGRAEFRTAADRAFDYVCRTRMDNWNWEGQFEDTPPSAPYQNLTKHPACSLAIYLGRRFPGDKARIAQMRELLRFAEDQFVCWERPCDGGPVRGSWGWRPVKSYSKWLTPCALEQYSCYWPIDASAAKLIRTYCALYRAEGRAIDLEKAKVLAMSVLKVQRADGSVPTWWFSWDGTRCRGGNDWQNCMVASAEALAELAEAADGTSDAERNGSAEMNAAKDVAAARRVEGGVRVLFLGNSITLHSPLESVGWTNRWGMAASCPENDFVHIVTRGIERETGRSADVRVRNVADFERDFAAWRPGPEIRELVDFDAQYVVFAFGENVPDLRTDAERTAWREAVKRFLSLFAHGRAKPHAVVRGVFWPNAWKDACLAHAASDLAFTFVRADFGKSRGMDAAGLFRHPGVARHPGDAGMAAIAGAILDGFFPKDSGYEAWVDGKPVGIRPIRVSRQPFNQWAPGYQRPVDQTEVAGMLRFETEGACRLRVRQTPFRGVLRPTTNVIVRPLSAGVKPTVDGSGDISFDLPKPGFYVLEIDGYHRPLEIFAQPKRDFAAERREANVVFGPGVHEPVVVKLKSRDRVYIDRDAVVYGSFQADGVEDVKVFGYGIICGARNRRDGNACYREGMDGAVRIIDSRRVTFDGPTVLDSCCWCVSAFNSSDLELANLKVTGAWRYNTDGIDICNSRRVRVRDCYVHSFDDALVVKGISHDYVAAKKVLSLGFPRHEAVEDVRFSGCVCWCGWGRTLEIGLETWAESFRGIVFEDCDLIHNNGGALSVHLGGSAVVEDAAFRNIRIECDGSEERAVLQTNREQKVTCPKGNACPWLLVTNGKMFARGGLYGSAYDFSKEPYGTVRRLTVENVSLRRTNGAPRPGLGAKAEPGTSFGSLSLSGVTLDGAPFEPTEGERENLRKSFSNLTAFGERADIRGIITDRMDSCTGRD